MGILGSVRWNRFSINCLNQCQVETIIEDFSLHFLFERTNFGEKSSRIGLVEII